MLTYKMVRDMFQIWESKGIKYQGCLKLAEGQDVYHVLTNGFLSRYLFLQPEELEAVSLLVVEKGAWPSKEVLAAFVEQVLGEQIQGQDFSESYERGPEEEYDAYWLRLGKLLFPKKMEEWLYANALNIRIVYESNYCCRHCKGICPYGNRMVGSISKADGHLVAKRVAGMCCYFKSFRDGSSVPRVVAEVQEEPSLQEQKQLKSQAYGQQGMDYEQGLFPKEAYN